MAEYETLGASFSIDVTNLKAGLSQANRLIRESESEFKAAAAGMDDWTESQEGLEARIKHLNNAQDLQKKKVKALEEQYEKAGYASDDMSAAAVKLRTDINKEKEALAKTERELKKQKEALENLEEAADDAADAEKELGEAAKDAADGFTVAKGAIATFIGNGLTKLTSAIGNAISSIANLAGTTREYRTIMASLDESSKLAGYSAEQTAQTYEHLYGVLGDAQTVATTTANLQAMGLEQGNLANLTNGVIGAWAKYGDSIPIDGLSEAVNHTMQLGEVQGNLADVIEWGGGTVEDFNEKLAGCKTETERANMIMDLFAKQGLVQAGEAWQKNNASIVEANKVQAEHERLTAEWGKKIEPITTKVREGFNRILEKLLELVGDVDMEAFGASIEAAFTSFIDNILPAIVDGLGWIIDHKDGIIAGIVGIGAAFAAFKVVSIIQAVVNALKGMTAAQYALNLAMSLNPIGLIVAAVAALVAAFVVLWNNCEGFRDFWINMWEKIKNAFNATIDWIVNAWNEVVSFFQRTSDSINGFFSKMWNGLVDGAKAAWQGVKNVFSTVASFFGDIFGKAWERVKKVFSTGGKIFDGIKDGIVRAFKTVVNAIIRGINTVVALPFKGLNAILDKIANVSIAGVKPFEWLTWRASIPEIPQLAKGGVVRQATTAIIGEDGAEAVVPLEKNTGWIKMLASELSAQNKESVVVNQTNNFAQAHSRLELYKANKQTAAAVRLALAGR